MTILPLAGANAPLHVRNDRAIHLAPAQRRAPVSAVAQVHVLAGRGLEGDRNFAARRRTPTAGEAITLIEAEVIEAVLAEHGIDLRRRPLTPPGHDPRDRG